MDWEDVKTFRVVMEAGTVRAAAKQLGVHHSTVSRRIEQLEKSLDTRLFERRPEGCFTTASGLIRATDRDPVPSRDIWILTHEDLRRTARVRAFMEFAEMVLRDNKAALQGVLPD